MRIQKKQNPEDRYVNDLLLLIGCAGILCLLVSVQLNACCSCDPKAPCLRGHVRKERTP